LLEEWIDSILEKSNQAENNRHEIIWLPSAFLIMEKAYFDGRFHFSSLNWISKLGEIYILMAIVWCLEMYFHSCLALKFFFNFRDLLL
jgi:hypothetical protein